MSKKLKLKGNYGPMEWAREDEQLALAQEIADKRYGRYGDDDVSRLLRLCYANGLYHAMLTPDDIGTIFNLVREAQVNYNTTEGCYPEVLKRFNEIKFKK